MSELTLDALESVIADATAKADGAFRAGNHDLLKAWSMVMTAAIREANAIRFQEASRLSPIALRQVVEQALDHQPWSFEDLRIHCTAVVGLPIGEGALLSALAQLRASCTAGRWRRCPMAGILP